jgi:hypothetical protein
MHRRSYTKWSGHYPTQLAGYLLWSMTLLPQPSASVTDVSWTLEREIVFYALAAVTIPIVEISGLALAVCTENLIRVDDQPRPGRTALPNG